MPPLIQGTPGPPIAFTHPTTVAHIMNVSWRTRVALALAAVALPAPAVAQDEPPDQGGGVGEVIGGEAVTRPGKKVPRSQVPVSVRVEGVTAESANALLESIRTLRHEVYSCPSCPLQTRRAGTCERCGVDLEPQEPSEVVARVELSVDRRFLSITLQPHHWGSLAELDALAQNVGASVRREEFQLPTHSRLCFADVDETKARRLRGALVDLEVVPAVTVVPDHDGIAWLLPKVDPPGSTTVGDVEEALAKMSATYRLADVQWAAYCPECGTRPTSEMGNPACKPK